MGLIYLIIIFISGRIIPFQVAIKASFMKSFLHQQINPGWVGGVLDRKAREALFLDPTNYKRVS